MSQDVNTQAYLHEVSLIKARRFRKLYKSSTDTKAINEALEDYIASRRMIEKPEEGKRFGAYEAFLTTQ